MIEITWLRRNWKDKFSSRENHRWEKGWPRCEQVLNRTAARGRENGKLTMESAGKSGGGNLQPAIYNTASRELRREKRGWLLTLAGPGLKPRIVGETTIATKIEAANNSCIRKPSDFNHLDTTSKR